VTGDHGSESVEDLAGEHLDVYESRTGWWHPERGDLEPPSGWTMLPSGDAFVTRRVKAGGVYWLAWLPRSHTRRHRRLIGLLAPQTIIEQATQAALDSATIRARRRESGTRSRQRLEGRHQEELHAAVLEYLAFAPEHAGVAESIAAEAAERAAVVGSGRVGRSRVIPLEVRAALAARAQIRHGHTDYHQQLDEIALAGEDDDLYRQVKAAAHDAVDKFLAIHRGE